MGTGHLLGGGLMSPGPLLSRREAGELHVPAADLPRPRPQHVQGFIHLVRLRHMTFRRRARVWPACGGGSPCVPASSSS